MSLSGDVPRGIHEKSRLFEGFHLNLTAIGSVDCIVVWGKSPLKDILEQLAMLHFSDDEKKIAEPAFLALEGIWGAARRRWQGHRPSSDASSLYCWRAVGEKFFDDWCFVWSRLHFRQQENIYL